MPNHVICISESGHVCIIFMDLIHMNKNEMVGGKGGRAGRKGRARRKGENAREAKEGRWGKQGHWFLAKQT